MRARLDLTSQTQTVRQAPPPTWGATPIVPPDAPDRHASGNGSGGAGGARGSFGPHGSWSGQQNPQAELQAFLDHIERLESLRALMAETIRHYYLVNGLAVPAGAGGPDIHELLFPQYWKRTNRPQQDWLAPISRPWEVAASDALRVNVRIDVRPGHPHAQIPPLVGPAMGLKAPIAPLPLSAEQLAKLPAPPLPARLREMLESALATPWNSQESADFYYAADRNLSPQQIQGALDLLPELENALGMALGKTPFGYYGTGIDVTASDGFERLAAERLGGNSTATGAYLYRLTSVYQEYKAEYYGLTRALERDLYERDPGSIHPRVHRKDAVDYLEAKYALAMEGLIWRAVRTSSPIMLDLDGDGALSVTGRSTAKDRAAGNDFVEARSVEFDLDGDGLKERIEWMAGDGMLVDDRDGGASRAAAGDGEIDGRRLFGDEGGRYANGYEKLQALDLDGDGRLTGAELDGLKVWVDDGDAKVREGELKSLRELGITEISTRMQVEQNAAGERLMRSTFVQNGETKATEDVWFAKG